MTDKSTSNQLRNLADTIDRLEAELTLCKKRNSQLERINEKLYENVQRFGEPETVGDWHPETNFLQTKNQTNHGE